MAYGLKYTLNFDDIHKTEPAKWLVEFYFQDYTGDSTELTGSGNPLVITYGENDQDRMAPIVGSKAEIEIIIEDEKFDKTQFFVIEQFQIKVEIYKDTVIWWSGYVKPDYCEFPYQPAPYPFKIIATDGIALLKNNLIDLTDIKEGDGFVNILNLIMERGLYETKTGYDNLKVISSLHRGGKEETFDNLSTRYELWVDEKGAYMNIYDILVQIATSFTGRFFANNGSFWFQRIADLVNSNPDVWQYINYDTDPTKDKLPENFFKILKGEISSSEMIYLNNDSFITIMSPYKQSLIDLDYKFRTWLQNGDWHDWDGTNFAHWKRQVDHGMVLDQHGSGTKEDPYTLFFAKDEDYTEVLRQDIEHIPNNISIRVSAKVKFLNTQRTFFRFFLARKNDDETYDFIAGYDPTNGTWHYNDENDPYDQLYYRNWLRRSGDENELSIDITLPKINLPFTFPPPLYLEIPNDYDTSDNIVFEIEIFDPDGSADDNSPLTGMEVSEIKVEFIANDYIGETYTDRTGKEYSKYNEIENFTLIDDISSTVANKLHYLGESEDQLWTSDEIPFPIDNFQAMALFSTMNIYDSPFELMTGTYYSNKVKFFNTIQRAFGEYKLFMQLYDEYNVKHCEHRMTLAEIKKNIGIDPGTTSIRKFKIK